MHGEGRDLLDHGVPDVLVMEHGWPVVIETEVNNHRSAERDALQRLGNKLAAGLGGRLIHASLALVYPGRAARPPRPGATAGRWSPVRSSMPCTL